MEERSISKEHKEKLKYLEKCFVMDEISLLEKLIDDRYLGVITAQKYNKR